MYDIYTYTYIYIYVYLTLHCITHYIDVSDFSSKDVQLLAIEHGGKLAALLLCSRCPAGFLLNSNASKTIQNQQNSMKTPFKTMTYHLNTMFSRHWTIENCPNPIKILLEPVKMAAKLLFVL